MKGKILALVVVAALLAGCATAVRLNRVSLGMTKEEAIRAVGRPHSTSAQGSREYLHYRWLADRSADIKRMYYVRLVDGRVDSYGQMGAFDSAKTPTRRVEIDAVVRLR